MGIEHLKWVYELQTQAGCRNCKAKLGEGIEILRRVKKWVQRQVTYARRGQPVQAQAASVRQCSVLVWNCPFVSQHAVCQCAAVLSVHCRERSIFTSQQQQLIGWDQLRSKSHILGRPVGSWLRSAGASWGQGTTCKNLVAELILYGCTFQLLADFI